MKFPIWAVIVAGLGASSFAHAQDAVVEGPGVQLGEGTVMHPSVGVETGFISNVFYEESSTETSPLLRLIARLAFGSNAGERSDQPGSNSTPEKIEFRAGINLEYDEYLSSNEKVRAQRGVAVGAKLHIGVNPKGAVGLFVDDGFTRSTRPTNFESELNLARDINSFKAVAKYQPTERTISAGLSFANTIDIFESSRTSFANRMSNVIGARVDWQFLPITRLYLDASYGFIDGLGDTAKAYKSSSTPLRGQLGLDTAVTERTTVRMHGGYGIGFYSAGADFSGYLYGLEFGYRYSPVGRVTVAYSRNFKDSINANYYEEHRIALGLDQDIGQIALSGHVVAGLRGYHGVNPIFGAPVRNDVIVSTDLKIKYVVRDWLALTGDVSSTVVSTEYRSMINGISDDPGYVRHQVMAGVSAAF